MGRRAGLIAAIAAARPPRWRALAHGRIREKLGIVDFTDAAAGNCERFESGTPNQNAGRAGWARDVASASVSTGACRIDKVPVRARRYDDWWRWWVPLPHVGGTTYANYSFELFIDSANCAAVSPAP